MVQRAWCAALSLMVLTLPVRTASARIDELPSFQFTYAPGVIAYGIACDAQDRVYVAEPGHHVSIWSADGQALGGFDSVAQPNGIAIGPDGHVWLTTSDSADVREFTPEGALLTTLTSPGPILNYPLITRFMDPRGVAVGADGRVYIADQGVDVIAVYSPTHQYETNIRTSPGLGTNTGAFTTHPQLAASSDGSIWATVPLLGSLLHLALGGTPLTAPTGPIGSPQGIALYPGSEALLWTNGWGPGEGLELWRPDLTPVGVTPENPPTWSNATYVAFDHGGHVHVTMGGGGIARFSMGLTPTQRTSWGALKRRWR